MMEAWTRLIVVEVVKSGQVLDLSIRQNQQIYKRKESKTAPGFFQLEKCRIFTIGYWWYKGVELSLAWDILRTRCLLPSKEMLSGLLYM